MLFLYIGDLTEYNRTVEEGNSSTFKCDSNSTSPFYYYRYYAKSINLSAVIADLITHDSNHIWPWAVYAVNISNSNARIMPNFVARSEYALTINLTVEFHNNLICCQGSSWRQSDDMIASLSSICYHVNVQCK